jgi:hypothetical protein
VSFLSFSQKYVLVIYWFFELLKALLIFLPNEYFFFLQTNFLNVKSTFRPLKRNPKWTLSSITLATVNTFQSPSREGFVLMFQVSQKPNSLIRLSLVSAVECTDDRRLIDSHMRNRFEILLVMLKYHLMWLSFIYIELQEF